MQLVTQSFGTTLTSQNGSCSLIPRPLRMLVSLPETPVPSTSPLLFCKIPMYHPHIRLGILFPQESFLLNEACTHIQDWLCWIFLFNSPIPQYIINYLRARILSCWLCLTIGNQQIFFDGLYLPWIILCLGPQPIVPM